MRVQQAPSVCDPGGCGEVARACRLELSIDRPGSSGGGRSESGRDSSRTRTRGNPGQRRSETPSDFGVRYGTRRAIGQSQNQAGGHITPAFQGPPDEAQVLRRDAPDGTYRFKSSVSHPLITTLIAWTAQLDPVSHRAADITVQPLRAGLRIDIALTNSDPGVGSIASAVVIAGGSDHGRVEFTPHAPGSTTISVVTPKAFTRAANSTSVIAFVEK
jgi:hypothetical protein